MGVSDTWTVYCQFVMDVKCSLSFWNDAQITIFWSQYGVEFTRIYVITVYVTRRFKVQEIQQLLIQLGPSHDLYRPHNIGMGDVGC